MAMTGDDGSDCEVSRTRPAGRCFEMPEVSALVRKGRRLRCECIIRSMIMCVYPRGGRVIEWYSLSLGSDGGGDGGSNGLLVIGGRLYVKGSAGSGE